MKNLFKHLKTIKTHRHAVIKACFKMGIPLQGLFHDLSKYSITELKIAKYYSGKGSPHQVCREVNGYSPSWIHHYHENKHHYQYWWDESEFGEIIPIKMPFKYVIEMFCDMISAGKTYLKDKWSIHEPIIYYEKCCRDKRIMNKKSEGLLVYLFENLNISQDEKSFYQWYKKEKKEIKKMYEEAI